MPDFIQEYFINPIVNQNDYAPYNAFNTLAYAAIALLAVYLIYRALKWKGVKIDEGFARAVLPFVVFGAALRVFEDGHLLPRVVDVFGVKLFPFVTPGIYVLTFVLLAISAVASLKVAGRGNAKAMLSKIGLGLAALALLALFTQVKYWAHGLGILVLAFVLLKAFEFAFQRLANEKLSVLEAMAFFGQALDGSASFTAIQFGSPSSQYFEQHVVGGALISGLGPIAFLLVKVIFGAAVVWFLRKEATEEKNYALILITIFGLGPGLRDLLRLACGV